MKTNRINEDGKSAQGRAQTKGAAATRSRRIPNQSPRGDALTARADASERRSILESGTFTPCVVGMAMRSWKLDTLAEFICHTLHGHSPWIRATVAKLPAKNEDPWHCVRPAVLGEALALSAAVWAACGSTPSPFRTGGEDAGLDLPPVQRQDPADATLRDVVGLAALSHPSASDVLSALAHAFDWCWHDLAAALVAADDASEAVPLLDAFCILESWAAEVEGMASDFDEPGRPTRLQLAAAAAYRAHYLRAAA